MSRVEDLQVVVDNEKWCWCCVKTLSGRYVSDIKVMKFCWNQMHIMVYKSRKFGWKWCRAVNSIMCPSWCRNLFDWAEVKPDDMTTQFSCRKFIVPDTKQILPRKNTQQNNERMRGKNGDMHICNVWGGLKSFTPTFKLTCSQCESQRKKIHRLYKFQSASNCSHKIVVALISATISILMLEHPDLTSWKTQHARNIKSMAAFIRVEQRSLSTRTNVLKVKWIYSTVTHSVCAPRRRRRRMKKRREGVTLDNMPTVETALSK